MSRLAKLLPAVERRDWGGPWGPSDGTIPGPTANFTGDVAGPVYEAQALRLIDAYACVSLLADAVSMLPLDGFRKAPGPDGFRTELQKTPLLLEQPDPDLERWDHISRMVTSLALRGNSYNAVLSRDSAGYPTAIRAIHPDDVTVRWSTGYVGKRVYHLRGLDQPLDGSDIIHVPLITTPGCLVGISPIEAGRRGLRLAIETEQFGDRWFAEGAAPSSVFESDEEVDDDDADRVVARWMASHGGRRRPAFLGGGLKWKPITITPNESQFLETRNANTTSIARLWRIPPHMIGEIAPHASQGGGKGLEEQGIGFVVFTLGPYLSRLEAAFTRQMSRPTYAKFNVGALLRGNSSDRFANYALGRQWGWLSVNDIRRLEDLPPLTEGGDSYLQPLNMIDAQDALKVLLKGSVTPAAAAPDPASEGDA